MSLPLALYGMEKTWLKHYPKYVAHTIDPNSYSSIVDVFKQSVQKFGDREAYLCMGARLTFNELDQLTDQFAGFLQK